MTLTVRIPSWMLEDDRRVLRVGEVFSASLTFEELQDTRRPGDGVQQLRGRARTLPDDRRTRLDCHPVLLDVGDAVLYWPSPLPRDGAVSVIGTVEVDHVEEVDHVDAPDEVPETTGVLRRIRMEWTERVIGTDDVWFADGPPRYEDVQTSYFPRTEPEPFDPEAEADLMRRARDAYQRAVTARDVRPDEPFTVALAGHTHRQRIAPGTRTTEWSGVLVDLEVTRAD